MYEPVVYLYISVIKIRYVTIVSNNTYTNENVFFINNIAIICSYVFFAENILVW